MKSNKESMVRNSEGETRLSQAIHKEMTAFERNTSNLQLFQRAITIDCGDLSPSATMVEECSAAIHNKSQTWNVFPVKKGAESPDVSILNTISAKKLVGFAYRTQLMKSTALLPLLNFGSSKQDLPWLLEILNKQRGDAKYIKFVSKIANYIIDQNLPFGILVEDASRLDLFTKDVLEYISTPGNISRIGAILWIVFHKKESGGDCALVQKSGMPLKHYIISKS